MSNLLVLPYRAVFECDRPVVFPPGKMTNAVRGALGISLRRLACDPACPDPASCPLAASCAYARMFMPRLNGPGPTGFADLPRPFVIRAPTTDGQRVESGRRFHVDLHLFDLARPGLRWFTAALSAAIDRPGPAHGRARLVAVHRILPNRDLGPMVFDGSRFVPDAECNPLALDLEPRGRSITALRLRFLTPTEFKNRGEVIGDPRFDVLMARARDRISSLARFYQNVGIEMDFRAFAERASRVRVVRADTRVLSFERVSTRTGHRHPLGGFIGTVEYAGDLAEFIPYLEAAFWTGVGRQTVWGHGAVLPEAF